MSYRVIWSDRAFDAARLAFFLAWETGGIHGEIDRSTATLNKMLASDPLTVGESRDGEERIAFEGPIQILFEPFPSHGIVIIYEASVNR